MYPWSEFDRQDWEDGSITYESHGNEDAPEENTSTFICIEGKRAKDVADAIYAAFHWFPMDSLPKEGSVLFIWEEGACPMGGNVHSGLIKGGKPWIVGSHFAFDFDPPTGWRPIL